jgi:hypothetical protein
MSRRTKLALVALAGAGVLAAALLTLDFHASRSETRANRSIGSFSMGKPQGSDAGVGHELKLVVQGENDLAAALRKGLEANLTNGSVFQGVEIAESPSSPVSNPALLVELPRQDIFWTPFHARGQLTVKVTYASDGDMSWRHDTVVHMDNRDGPVLRSRGEFQIDDTTTGVISLRHYHNHLGLKAAIEVSESIEKSVSSPAG